VRDLVLAVPGLHAATVRPAAVAGSRPVGEAVAVSGRVMTRFERLQAELVRRGAMVDSPIHGRRHWAAVTTVGLRLAELTDGADRQVVRLFGVLHDAQRVTDYRDRDHGPRAAVMVRRLAASGLLGLDDGQVDTLALAVHEHSMGKVTTNPTVGCCWDADRSQLPFAHPRFLSTAAIGEPGMGAWARRQRHDAPTLEELFRRWW
jgi:uncharacterized protein